MIEKLHYAGLKTVSVSIDGLEKTHNWFRQTKNGYQKSMKAIEMLKGVVNISLYKEVKEETTTPSQQVYSQRIQRLRGVAKGITQQQIEEDDRLAYLMNK